MDERPPPPTPAGAATLAAKLDRLFRTAGPDGRGEYTYAEVARAIRRRGWPEVTAAYLYQLRRGTRVNPTKRQLEALADVFGVEPASFFDDPPARVLAELELAEAMDPTVRELVLLADGLSARTLAAFVRLLARLRELEGLPELGGPPGAASGAGARAQTGPAADHGPG